MAVTYQPGSGFQSVPDRPSDPFSNYRRPRTGGGGGGGGRRSTPEQPTPSASELFGSPEEREAQIAAFRSGGRAALEASVAQARQKAIEVARQQAEKQRQLAEQARIQKTQAFLKFTEQKQDPFAQFRQSRIQTQVAATQAKEKSFLQRTKERALKIYDEATGKSYSLSQLSKEQSKINKEVEEYNRIYGNRKLTEQEYERAQRESRRLSSEQERINRLNDKLVATPSAQIYSFFNPFEKRLTIKERQEQEAKGGAPQILTGDLPIAPTGFLSKTITGVRFAGTERTLSGGRTLVDIKYITSAGKTGQAISVAKQEGEIFKVATIGRSSGKSIVFPTGKIKPTNVLTYTGVERGISKQGQIAIDVLKGKINAQRLFEGSKQLSAGRVLTRVGRKIPTKKSKLDDFISVSRAIVKDEKAIVAGKTLTIKGQKIKYAGVITKEVKPQTFDIKKVYSPGSFQTQQQISKQTIQQALGTITAAEAKPFIPTTTQAVLGVGLSSTLVTPRQLQVPQQQVKQTTSTRQILQTPQFREQSLTSVKDITSTSSRTRARLKELQKTPQQTKTIEQTIIKQEQRPVQRLGLRQQQQLKQQTALRGFRFTPTPSIKPVRRFIFGLKSRVPKETVSSGKFIVSVRRRGKFQAVGVTKDVRKAFAIGERVTRTTLARTFKISGLDKVDKVPKGFYGKISKKEGRVYIQKAKTSLSSKGEISEIKRTKKWRLKL